MVTGNITDEQDLLKCTLTVYTRLVWTSRSKYKKACTHKVRYIVVQGKQMHIAHMNFQACRLCL